MKTIYILATIILLGAAVFAYFYKQEDINAKTPVSPVNMQNINAPVATTATSLNPAHGLPNHRCDLPVGAPLTITAEQKSAAPMLPKTNPQHGMPGHRCDLAVGATL
ncbi:MAG: hypothetical protein H7096_02200 [Flavobacterium sp.]|nr:hypothetical protein [Pedobacter sp.]